MPDTPIPDTEVSAAARAIDATHFHDCPWGTGGKHICFNRACADIAGDEPEKGAPFHG